MPLQQGGRHPCHAEINGIIQQFLGSAKIPCDLEPTGLLQVRWQKAGQGFHHALEGGKVLVCNVTCPDNLATSYSAVAAREAGAVAERRKKA